MEQQTGLNLPPVHAVATDPAFIPGLTSPRPGAPDDEGGEQTPASSEQAGEAAPGAADAGSESGSEAVADTDVDSDTDVDADTDVEAGADTASASAGDTDDPSFEAADRRGSIVADRTGVRFRLDDQEAEFDWSEINAVEHETTRFGRRFVVTVHMDNNRWYPAEVAAPDKAALTDWSTRLDAVLDAYFEE